MTRRSYPLRALAARGVRGLRRLQRHDSVELQRIPVSDAGASPSTPPSTKDVDGYLCEVVAWGMEKPGGDGGEIYLGGYWADTPRDAVRWLASRAAWLAERLDPQPGEGWAQGDAAAALRQLPEELPEDWPDPGRTLREWYTDASARLEATHDVLNGEPFVLATRDYTAFYSLSIRPAVIPGRDALPTPNVAAAA